MTNRIELRIVFYGHEKDRPSKPPATVWIVEGTDIQPEPAAIVTLSDDGENWAAMGWTPTGPRQVSKNTSYEGAVAKALSHARSIIDGSVRENDEWTASKLVQQTTFWRAISPTTAIEPAPFENLVHDHGEALEQQDPSTRTDGANSSI